MSSFTSKLLIEPLEDGRTYRLVRPFSYHIGTRYSRIVVRVPKNFLTDFASIPKWLWAWLPDWARINKPSVAHDFMYRCLDWNRALCDAVFYEMMLIDFRKHKTGKFYAFIEWLAVRIFGRKRWMQTRYNS